MIFHDSDLDVIGHAVIPPPGGIYCNTGCRTGNIRVENLVRIFRFVFVCDSREESGGPDVPSAQWELAVRSEAASLNQIMYMILFLLERLVCAEKLHAPSGKLTPPPARGAAMARRMRARRRDSRSTRTWEGAPETWEC